MSEKPEELEEAMDSVSEAAEQRVEAIEDLGEAAAEEAKEGVVEGVEEEPTTFEERLEQVASEAGNFMAKNITVDLEANENDKLWSLFAYLSQAVVPVIVPLLMLLIEPNKDRPFQKFHAVQSLGFLVLAFVYEVLAGIVYAVLTAITLGCLGAILWILFLLPVVPAVYYAYLAYQGKRFDIPWLTDFMRGQGWV